MNRPYEETEMESRNFPIISNSKTFLLGKFLKGVRGKSFFKKFSPQRKTVSPIFGCGNLPHAKTSFLPYFNNSFMMYGMSVFLMRPVMR